MAGSVAAIPLESVHGRGLSEKLPLIVGHLVVISGQGLKASCFG